VKFLLATTDPQKLPVTVLSRCLQFNLKRLDEGQIAGQITKILAAEDHRGRAGAVRLLARAADGSLRDGLSLLDQAIAYTGGQLNDAGVATMLGTVDSHPGRGHARCARRTAEGARLLDIVAALAEFSPDWNGVLDALADALHRVQVRQLVPERRSKPRRRSRRLAARLRPEVVQLWYQMALERSPRPARWRRAARRFRDERVAHAGVPAGGRSVPATDTGTGTCSHRASNARSGRARDAWPRPRAGRPRASRPEPAAAGGSRRSERVPRPEPPCRRPAPHASTPNLADCVATLRLRGRRGTRGACRLRRLRRRRAAPLALAADDHMKVPGLVKRLADALGSCSVAAPDIKFDAAPPPAKTLHQRSARERDARQVAAETAFLADPDVQRLMTRHGADAGARFHPSLRRRLTSSRPQRETRAMRGNIAQLMQQAQKMQENVQRAQEEVAKIEVTGSAGGGMVNVTITGRMECRKVRIDPSVLSDPEMAEDLVAAAFNDAVNKVNAESQEGWAPRPPACRLPPGMKLPF
jgi:DNA polymerase-3 subunit gamma/tau